MKTFLPGLLVVFLCLFAAINVRAWAVDGVSSPHVSKGSTLVVTKTEDTADGVCDADCSLREAVTAAASGDTVVFSTLFDTPPNHHPNPRPNNHRQKSNHHRLRPKPSHHQRQSRRAHLFNFWQS